MKHKYSFNNNNAVTVYNEDALEALSRMKDNSIDSVVTDPPYGLNDDTKIDYSEVMQAWAEGREPEIKVRGGFANLPWDSFVPSPAIWKECLRVLKPGGLLVAFAGTRTQDLMGISIRMAGFRIKDMITWNRTAAFFKGTYLNKRIEGMEETVNSNLRNVLEPITVAQKPITGPIYKNLEKWGVGGFFFDGNFVPYAPGLEKKANPGQREKKSPRIYGVSFSLSRATYAEGRVPTNILFSHNEECNPKEINKENIFSTSRDTTGCVPGCYISKMPFKDSSRNYILIPDKVLHIESWAQPKERVYYIDEDGKEVYHHTVKPLNLMRWITRLVTPPGGVTLDPFLGSGTTAEAAVMEGRSCIGSEMSTDYIGLIEKRMERVEGWLETKQ